MHKPVTVYLGADHGGFALKEQLKGWLVEQGYRVGDCGAFTLDPDDDYPDFAWEVAQKVARDANSRGVLLCRSSAGMTITANKHRGVRAVSLTTAAQAEHARVHNNANIASFSGDELTLIQIKETLKVFLETEFPTEERHVRRLAKITAWESEPSRVQ